MDIVSTFGPLIENGEIDGACYEVRGVTNPMIYVYRAVKGRYHVKATQVGGSPAASIARMLALELPKA